MESTKREWFTSFYVGERIHSDVEAQARSKDVVALIDFDDWKNNRMPSNPDFGTRNRKSFSEMTKEITDVALQGIKKQRDNLEVECKLLQSKLESMQTAYNELYQKNRLLEDKTNDTANIILSLQENLNIKSAREEKE